MALKDVLMTETNIDPHQVVKSLPIHDLTATLTNILEDKSELELLKSNPLYLENMYKMVRYAYLKHFSKLEVQEPKVPHKASRTKLFNDATLERLYSIT